MKYPEKPWQVTCPSCRTQEWITLRQRGERYKCPKCKKTFNAGDHVKHTQETAPVRTAREDEIPAVVIWDTEFPLASDELDVCRLGAKLGKVAALIYLRDLVLFEQEVIGTFRKKGLRFRSCLKSAKEGARLCCGICSREIPEETVNRIRLASNLDTYQQMPETERNLARDPVCYRCTSNTAYYVFTNPEGPVKGWWKFWFGGRKTQSD